MRRCVTLHTIWRPRRITRISTQRQAGAGTPDSTSPLAEEQACEAQVARRARAGLATICVAVLVAGLVLAGSAATLLVTGIIPLSGLEGRISAAIEERIGHGWQVDASSAELERVNGHSQLRVRQVSFRHSGGAAIRAPEAVLGYDPLSLLRGSIRLTSVDLRGVNVRLGVDKGGALVVNADSAPAEAPPAASLPDTAQWNVVTGIMGAISTLARGDGLLGALETAGIAGARLSLVDPEGRQTAGLEDVEIRLSRVGEATTRLTMKGRTGPRWKDIAIDLSTEADGTQRADVDIRRFEPAEIMALAFGTGGMQLEGLPLQGKATLRQNAGGKQSITAALDVQAGILRFPDGGPSPVKIDAAHLEIASGEDLSHLTITGAKLAAGATRFDATGSLAEEGGAWRLKLQAGGQLAGLDSDPPVPITQLNADLKLDVPSGIVSVDSLALRGPTASVDMNAFIQKVGESPLQRFHVAARDSDARALLAIWPAFTSPDAHDTLRRQLVAGRMKSVVVDLDLPAEDHARLLHGAGMPVEALTVAIDGDAIRYLPDPGLPPVVDAAMTGTVTGRSVRLAIAGGKAELGSGRSLQLGEGSFAIPDFWMHRAPASIGFRATGTMDALAALFGFPAVKDFSPGKIDPAAIKGGADLKVGITLPLAPDVKTDEIVITGGGTLSGVASDTLLGTEKLEAGSFATSFDRNGFQLRGEAKVGGDKAQIDIRQNAKGQGEAVLQLMLDAAARQRRGFGPESGISGVVPVKVTKAFGKSADAPPHIEMDLAKAGLDAPIPGLSKAAGKPGKIAFTYVMSSDGPDLEDFVLDTGTASMKGRIELDRKNGLESASFSQFRLSPGDNVKVEIKRDGNLSKLTIRGAVADIRPFIKDLQNPAQPPASARGVPAQRSAGGDIDVDLDVPILTGFNSEAITNGTMKLSRRGGDIRSLAFQGRIGRADVSARQARPNDKLVVQSENGGSLLRFLDLYNRAYGGDLVLSMGSGDSQSGELLFRNFVVRNEPALKRVVASQPAATTGDGSAAGAGPRIDVADVEFTKLRAEFTRSASRLDVSDMVIWGQQVGFTLQGHVDYGRDRVDIGGTFVPGYAFNNAFAQVPVVGALLGGGSQYGGLFAVNFRISGAASAPTMTINPLSALAPGILRRFVDPLGGAPAQKPIQPPPPATRP